MEYTIDGFVESLRQYMYSMFPYESDELNEKKHPNRKGHIRDVAFMNLPITVNMDQRLFDIGSYMSEATHPYYHILQQAPTIRKRNKGTKKSKGSQAYIENLGTRDYERVKWNGKTYSKEYSKNIRGARKSVVDNATRYYTENGQTMVVNKDANAYVNIHYQYIDKMLEVIAPILADEYGMKLKSARNTDLGEEYELQQNQDIEEMLDILNSFDEE